MLWDRGHLVLCAEQDQSPKISSSDTKWDMAGELWGHNLGLLDEAGSRGTSSAQKKPGQSAHVESTQGVFPRYLAEPWNKGPLGFAQFSGENSVCAYTDTKRHRRELDLAPGAPHKPPLRTVVTVRYADSMRMGPIFRPKLSITKLGGFFNVLQWIFFDGLQVFLCTLNKQNAPKCRESCPASLQHHQPEKGVLALQTLSKALSRAKSLCRSLTKIHFRDTSEG